MAQRVKHTAASGADAWGEAAASAATVVTAAAVLLERMNSVNLASDADDGTSIQQFLFGLF